MTLYEGVSFLDGFAIFVSSLVLFKFFFALLYQLKWYVRLCCKADYKKNKIDIQQAFKKLKKKRNPNMSTDEEEDEEAEMDYQEEEEGAVGASENKPSKDITIHIDHIDSDDDDQEFDDADHEEEEDRLQEMIQKSQSSNQRLEASMRKGSNQQYNSMKTSVAYQNGERVNIESVISINHDNILPSQKPLDFSLNKQDE